MSIAYFSVRDNSKEGARTPQPTKKFPLPPNREIEDEEDDEDREEEEIAVTTPEVTTSQLTVASTTPSSPPVLTSTLKRNVPIRSTPAVKLVSEVNTSPVASVLTTRYRERVTASTVKTSQAENVSGLKGTVQTPTPPPHSDISGIETSSQDYYLDHVLHKFFNISKPYEEHYSG